MKFEVTILGCGSATPTLRHSPTSQLVNHEEQYFLIDCGEGTQLQLRRFGLKFQKINHIFISHLHGDHYFGLPGLLSTFHLLGRTNALHIYTHADLQQVMESQLKISHSHLRYPVHWHALNYDTKVLLFESEQLEIFGFPLSHRIPTCGFLIRQKPKPRNIISAFISRYNIPVARIRQIKDGSDYTLPNGEVLPNDMLTTAPDPPRSYAFCSDTAFAEKTAQYVKGVDTLYHESTFLKLHAKRAKETFHSTAGQAAQVAILAGAKKLILGHFSARYHGISEFQSEASEIHPHVILAEEGQTYPV